MTNAASVLLVHPAGDRRDALLRALEAKGADVDARDDSLDALAGLAPDAMRPSTRATVVLVSDDPGPPGAESLCRLLGRKLHGASVYRLGEPGRLDALDALDGGARCLPPGLDADSVASALLDGGAVGAVMPAAVREWTAPEATDVAPLLLALGERRSSGRLVVTTDTSERVIWIYRGFSIFAESTDVGERLGAVGVSGAILTSDAVSRALDAARPAGLRIGEALVRLGALDGASLYDLLAAQLMDRIAGAINARDCRATFHPDAAVPSRVPLFRLHPLTATLASVERLSPGDVARVMTTLGPRMSVPSRVSPLVENWLRDVGIEDSAQLLAGPFCVRELRDRLEAGLPEDEAAFARSGSPPDKRSRADDLTFALLRAGIFTLHGNPTKPPVVAHLGALAPAMLTRALERASEGKLDGLPVVPLEAPKSERERRIIAYLDGPASSREARASALRGPLADGSSGGAELVQLYLGLQHLSDPRAILGLAPAADAHAAWQRHEVLARKIDDLARGAHGDMAACRIAEIRAKLDSAIDAFGVGQSAPQLPEPALASSLDAPPVAPSSPSSRRDASASPGQSLEDLEPLLREGSWDKVVALLAQGDQDPRDLPPSRALVYAVALKETTVPRTRAGGKAALDPDLLGVQAVSRLLGVSEQSATALVLAKRTLRRRSGTPPMRFSVVLLVLALVVGTAVGALVGPGAIQLLWH